MSRVIVLLFSMATACTIFPAGETEQSPPNLQEHRFARVRYELINWENIRERNSAPEMLMASLSASANFIALEPGVGGDGWYLQIVLEEYPGEKEMGSDILDRPLRWFLKSLNNYASGQPFLIFPWIRHKERRIRFSVWQSGQLRGDYAYHSDAYVVIGWVSILLAGPSRSAYLENDMARIARLFIADAARDGLFGGEPQP